jgi:hypothetical protein
MARLAHPKKEVEYALKHAESHGWDIKVGGSHAWGKMYCPYNDDSCRCGRFCIVSIWSTPKNPMNHARDLRRVVNNCTTLSKRCDVGSAFTKGMAMEFTFTLSYRLSAQDSDQDELVERLGAAGFTDALIGIGRRGYLVMVLNREAASAEAALFDALDDIQRTIPTAQLIETEPECDLTPDGQRTLKSLLP